MPRMRRIIANVTFELERRLDGGEVARDALDRLTMCHRAPSQMRPRRCRVRALRTFETTHVRMTNCVVLQRRRMLGCVRAYCTFEGTLVRVDSARMTTENRRSLGGEGAHLAREWMTSLVEKKTSTEDECETALRTFEKSAC